MMQSAFQKTNAPAARQVYVTTTGSDANDGLTVGTPKLTWQGAFAIAVAGDEINIAPGTYPRSGAITTGCTAAANGTSVAPITVRSTVPGTRPVLDCNLMNVGGSGFAIGMRVTGNWWRFTDIEVANVHEPTAAFFAWGIYVDGTSNHIFTRVMCHHCEGPGMKFFTTSSNNLVLNSDFHSCYDPGHGGGNADGLQFNTTTAGSTGNVVDGCRSYDNADDGYDLWEAIAPITIRNCWAFRNGWIPGTSNIPPSGNGNGFKLGRSLAASPGGPVHVVTNNSSFDNRSNGFDSNGATGLMQLYNNTSYNNGGSQYTLTEATAFVMRNNIAVPDSDINLHANVDDTFNSWNLAATASAADFVSVDTTLADDARAADGTLPAPNLFRLTGGSDMINAGTNVGLPFNGAAPDLGAYET